ncbi:MAG: phosphotransferase [Betaproteobacteria bacterium AqS2]|uniref:Homoserine kinase n=1 Tax=Candidatus Amphirhobacter heronislandensis TaxID=1732024 RepID=A0A930XWN6_9GAMM|nr:phosphotransferase [Betaproteobacteria bacterium AqS2]
MAVFTQADHADAAPWLRDNYGIELTGELEPITEGIENSNYRFTAADGARYIFTVIEVWDEELAGWCVRLARHLHDRGEPVPRPLRNRLRDGPLGVFAAKPAVVVDFVDGAWLPAPDASQCGLAGGAIARLHRAAADFAPLLPNPRGAAWRRETAAELRPSLPAADQELLDAALARDEALQASGLPRGACHCDLFRNNFLWRDGAIAGVIDFYFAGEDFLLFDLAVAAIDWTMDEDGAVDGPRLAALLAAYRAGRAPDAAEAAAFGDALVAGALRFWLSRLLDVARPRDAYALQPHDPVVFRRRLARCLADRERLAAALLNG